MAAVRDLSTGDEVFKPVITSLSWRKLSKTVMKSSNNPPLATATGPAILQLFKETVLPTNIKTEPPMTKIRGVKRS